MLYLVRLHAMDNWTDEIDVEDGEYVDEVEDHGKSQESSSSKPRHREDYYRKERLR